MAAFEIYVKNLDAKFYWRASNDFELSYLGADRGATTLPKGEIYISGNDFYYVDGNQRLRSFIGSYVSGGTAGEIHIGSANDQFYFVGSTGNKYRRAP